MKVQHPDKRAHTILPANGDPVTTDSNGIAEVSSDLGKSLKAQGWTEVKSARKKED